MTGSSGWLWLTLPLSILVAAASIIGLAVPGFYSGPAAWAVQGQAQDFMDLVIVLPALVISALLAARGSVRGRLVWLGALSYLVYTFVIYTFGVPFNALFLAYVAALACSAWALIGGMARTDWREIAARLSERSPRRVVSIVLFVIAGLAAFSWLRTDIPAVIAGSAPPNVQEIGTPTNPVHVLDFAFLLPSAVIAGIWLLQRRPLGYGLAAVITVNLICQGLAIALIGVFSMRAGFGGGPGQVVTFALVSVIQIMVLAWYLGRMTPAGKA